MIPLRPFRTPRQTGEQVGWGLPIAAVVIALILPTLMAMSVLFVGMPTVSGPPKDGSGYTLWDHFAIFIASLAASFVVSWMLVPFAIFALRAAVMLGFAGWAAAALAAISLGLPVVHVALMGDLTTEDSSILPHIIAAILFLGVSVWAAFWGLFALRSKRSNRDQT